MNVKGIGGTGAAQNTAGIGAGGGAQTDPVSKNLQQQIEKLQNDLKEVSANPDMTADAKMKKRQDIQKQISELQIQLRQHQIEARKAEREKKKEESSFDDLLGAKSPETQDGVQNTGMSAGSMTAMISADVSLKQANVQGSIAQKMEGRANVLKQEMKLDGGRGGDTSRKAEELADVEATAQKATAGQLSSLAQAGEALENAAKADKAETKKKDEEKDEKESVEETTAADGKPGEITDDTSAVSAESVENTGVFGTEGVMEQTPQGYHPVDVRL